MKYMAGLKDNSFDLAVADPPYGIGVNHNMGRRKGDKPSNYKSVVWDSKPPDKQYFDELIRVSINQIIFGANYFISKIPYDSSCWIVWDKDNSGDFADCELAWTSFKTAVRKFRYRWNGMLQENMKEKEHRIHPTQKPVALYSWIFRNYAKPGQRVLDTHLGSGSSAIAAHYAGLEFTGCEIDKDYYQAACDRVHEETRQMRLFAA